MERMAFYHDVVLPRICDLAMRNRRLRPYRERVVSAAEGRVLEIGVGSGLNFGFYRPGVHEILALEPDPKLLHMAGAKTGAVPEPVSFIEGSAEAIPLDDTSIDTAVTTWTLCTIPDALRALEEVRRVLRPGGRLLFVEHGLAPEWNVQRWQHRLTPLWSKISGGCHLDRPIADLIASAGFRIETLDTGYAPGPKMMAFMSEGSARPG
jgi:ubiquinone/menaquinone biosynthesis C-methylase UbiE